MKPTLQKMRTYAVLVLIGLFAGTSVSTRAQQVSVSFQVFYDELQPYGSWFNHPDFGYAWMPNVDSDFTPYLTNGYWAVTQYGNTWVSHYNWGWATFHYGRWYYDDFYGWIWVPDTEWAPAWVVWRNGGGYYGWAPLSPGLHFSLTINLFGRIPNHCWVFVPNQYVWHESVYSYCAPRNQNINIVNNTTYVTNYYNNERHSYFTGPSHDDIEKVTNRPVKIHRMEEEDRPGRTNVDRETISLYRPSITKKENDRPTRSVDPTQYKRQHQGRPDGQDQGDQQRGQKRNESSFEDQKEKSEKPDKNQEESYWDDDQNKTPNQTTPNRSSDVNDSRSKSQDQNIPNRSSNWNNNRNGNSQQTAPNRSSYGNDNRNKSQDRAVPNRSSTPNNNQNRNSQQATPNRSGNNSNTASPNRSGGSRGSSMSVPSKSGGATMNTPNKSSGSKSGSGTSTPQRSGGSKSSGEKKKN